MDAKRQAIEVAKAAGDEVVPALEREAQRRRADPGGEVARLEHRLARLPRWRWLARVVTLGQLGRARDRLAAAEAGQ